jgi:hypothetical protein
VLLAYHKARRYTRGTRGRLQTLHEGGYRRYTRDTRKARSFCKCHHKRETISFLPVSRENLALKVLDE